jgi:hypothetical protein
MQKKIMQPSGSLAGEVNSMQPLIALDCSASGGCCGLAAMRMGNEAVAGR